MGGLRTEQGRSSAATRGAREARGGPWPVTSAVAIGTQSRGAPRRPACRAWEVLGGGARSRERSEAAAHGAGPLEQRRPVAMVAARVAGEAGGGGALSRRCRRQRRAEQGIPVEAEAARGAGEVQGGGARSRGSRRAAAAVQVRSRDGGHRLGRFIFYFLRGRGNLQKSPKPFIRLSPAITDVPHQSDSGPRLSKSSLGQINSSISGHCNHQLNLGGFLRFQKKNSGFANFAR
jgi:hypothetical protein